jgi:hypothetical protein
VPASNLSTTLQSFFQLADNERVLLAFGMELRLQLVEGVAGPAQGDPATE